MKNFAKTIVTLIAIIISSCGGPKPELSKDQCAEIIFQMHRADAIISIKGFNDKNLNNDSLSYYNEIFANQNITKKQFIETIRWYINHPEQYKDLYDVVIKKVSQYEQDENIRFKITGEKDSNDVWNMKRDFYLPLDGETNPIAIDIPITQNGTYTLTFDAICYEDDMSENPRTTLIVEYEDGTTDLNVVYDLVKDGKHHNVKLILKTDDKKVVKRLKGWVLDHSDNTKKKHIDCYNISIKYTKE